MAQLTIPPDTWATSGESIRLLLAVDEAKWPVEGAIAAIDADGNVVSAAHATAVKAIGRCDKIIPVDSQSGDDQARVEVRRGVIALFNDSVAPCVQANLFGVAELGDDDDATAAAPGTGNLLLGPFVKLEEGRVFVLIDGVSGQEIVAAE